MKSFYRLIILLSTLYSLFGLRTNKNLKSQTNTESLTFYQMALQHRGHHSHRARREDAPKAAEPATAPANNKTEAAAAPANNTKANNKKLEATNVVGALHTKEVIVEASPYTITRCDQVVMFNAQTLADEEDYLSRKDAFFTISAYLINMFQSKDSNQLLESVNLAHITNIPGPLKGTKDCLIFLDSLSVRNVVMCFKSENEMLEIEQAYSALIKCRLGGETDDFDPSLINKILNFSCNGFESSEGVEYDLPDIRKQIAEELSSKGEKVEETIKTKKIIDKETGETKHILPRVPGT